MLSCMLEERTSHAGIAPTVSAACPPGVPLSTSTLCSDDIGALSIHRQGTYVATADDAGECAPGVASWGSPSFVHMAFVPPCPPHGPLSLLLLLLRTHCCCWLLTSLLLLLTWLLLTSLLLVQVMSW